MHKSLSKSVYCDRRSHYLHQQKHHNMVTWIPLMKASDAKFDVFFVSEQTVEQTIGTPVIWVAIAHIMTSL